MTNRRANSGSSDRFYFLGLQKSLRTESKRHLLLGRKAMTNIESVLKSRDITLLTKVVMYRCELWIIKKAECQRSDAF